MERVRFTRNLGRNIRAVSHADISFQRRLPLYSVPFLSYYDTAFRCSIDIQLFRIDPLVVGIYVMYEFERMFWLVLSSTLKTIDFCILVIYADGIDIDIVKTPCFMIA